MAGDQFITLDKIKWWITTSPNGTRSSQPICPDHGLRLRPIKDYFSNQYNYWNDSRSLKCEECEKIHGIPRSYQDEQQYILDKLDAKVFKGFKYINLDDEALPIAEDKVGSKDNKYFVTSRLMQSKTGLRLVVYAGEKGSEKKTQIFVEPEIKRLSFDQKDLHPTEVFAELEATFIDGTRQKMKKPRGVRVKNGKRGIEKQT